MKTCIFGAAGRTGIEAKLGKSNEEINKYKLTAGGPAELLTSRKKAARVLVDLVNHKEYMGKLPIISG